MSEITQCNHLRSAIPLCPRCEEKNVMERLRIERDALKARVAERGDSIYITDGHGTLYGTPEVIGWITDELDRLESTLAQRDREVLALREGLGKIQPMDGYAYSIACEILASTAQAGEDAERRLRQEERDRIAALISDHHNRIVWRVPGSGSIHADPRLIRAALEPNP